MTIKMTAENASWPKEEDPIFAIAERADNAIRDLGRDKVINATLGSLYDDDGNLITLNTVFDELKHLRNDEIAAYSPIAGNNDFQEDVVNVCFGDYKPDAYFRAVYTPGGTGAVRHCIWTYAGASDPVICPDWYWKPYKTICDEFEREFITYPIFDENFQYNVEGFEKTFRENLKKNKRIISIFNTPANNPTGYSISDDEWDKILDIIKDEAKDMENRITILLDIAYIEYAGDGSQKKFFKKFSNLPENVFVLVAFSMSKSYTAYGLRTGAAVGLSSSQEIVDEFFYSCSHANRSNWSNGVRSSMQILSNIYRDEQKSKSYHEELEQARKLLERRAETFVTEADKVGLRIFPYRGGFFISIPTENSQEIGDELEANNLFAIALPKGIRFAVCAVPEDQCKIAPKIIKDIMDKVEKNK
ncbi:MAG: aminotransferase class I/II-fold pyridoxal phosphate-dependent enzyme [Finegoldia sp.]|nr:aminotransferase class I/II-fold pyridoxal phosphate-dependent enzyme [Finegoldia sp.]